MLLPMLLLTALGAVEHLLARRALGLGCFLAHGAQSRVVIKLLDQTHLKSRHEGFYFRRRCHNLTVGSAPFISLIHSFSALFNDTGGSSTVQQPH